MSTFSININSNVLVRTYVHAAGASLQGLVDFIKTQVRSDKRGGIR
jgi:hypothetical protein